MRIGVDLGGTKIEAVALDRHGAVCACRRSATPDSCDAVVLAIRDLVVAVETAVAEPCSVGVGTPGSLSPKDGLLRNSNTTCLNGVALDRLLQRALQRDVRLANDADCFALSEARDGAGTGAAVVFGVILGTGTGGGLVVDGKIRRGPNALGGEWGHNPLPWSSLEDRQRPCYCGKQGCIETFLSGPGLVATYRALGGMALSARQIAEEADEDALAAMAVQVYIEQLGRSLATVVNQLDPDVVVLGGGVSNMSVLYESLPKAIRPWVFGDYFNTPIRQNRHGDSSGVRGAAWLWPPAAKEGAGSTP